MRYYTVTMCIIAGLLLVGCIPSIHPLFTPDAVAFDPHLVGTWKPEKGDGTLQFTKADEKAYRMVYTGKDGKADTFRVHLTKIDRHLFLDFSPDEEVDLPHTDLYKVHLIPAHTFSLVHEISEKSLNFSFVNPEWLGEYLKETPQTLKHEWRDEKSLVLTASTEDLRNFFSKHVKTPSAFAEEPSAFVRVAEGATPKEEAKEAPEKAAEGAPE